jgi:signal peptidase I
VIVFERPASETSSDIPDLIKRVVGLPGESISFVDGAVYVDGRRLEESYLIDGTATTSTNAPHKCPAEAPCIVPPGQVWVMGDNRPNSTDSRYHQDLPTGGFVPISVVVGNAFVISWPFDNWTWLSNYPDTFSVVPNP